MRTFLENLSPYVGWLGGLGVPLAILISGWLITSSIESSKLESEYVKMALTILSTQRKDADGKVLTPTPDELALRQWAVRLLNKQSPEKFLSAEQAALLKAPTPLLSPEQAEALKQIAIRAGVYVATEAVRKVPSPAASGPAGSSPQTSAASK